ncbi:hypothetical protein [uncultured Devosia sp.]|uniref:hypothetical protein n=1 Tax=uncultured Devosia sp. TaxID=211434 RepID=UPI0035CA92B3
MGLRTWATGLAAGALMVPGAAMAGEAGYLLRTHLYDGTIVEGLGAVTPLAEAGDPEAKFAAGLLTLVNGLQRVSQDLYKYGPVAPDFSVPALLFGMPVSGPQAMPANPNPEPITYEKFRTVLNDFVTSMDASRALLEAAGEDGDYVVALEPLKFRFDADGDGAAEPGETLGDLLGPAFGWADIPFPDGPPPAQKRKDGVPAASQDLTIGFDRADAIWFAGYSQVAASQADFLLAHDFHDLVDAYFHRFFPKSGLPMQDTSNGTLMMDPATDTSIADVVAAIHTLNFPVIDTARLAGIRQRLLSITALSRRNWDAILAETDDDHELVPSPGQTPMSKDLKVDEDVVKAWMATLDTADQILNGELLVPHWRLKQGFDLKAYFETATQTDLIMILTGLGAKPFLKDGPVATAANFADANRVFGDQWLGYAFWFN